MVFGKVCLRPRPKLHPHLFVRESPYRQPVSENRSSETLNDELFYCIFPSGGCRYAPERCYWHFRLKHGNVDRFPPTPHYLQWHDPEDLFQIVCWSLLIIFGYALDPNNYRDYEDSDKEEEDTHDQGADEQDRFFVSDSSAQETSSDQINYRDYVRDRYLEHMQRVFPTHYQVKHAGEDVDVWKFLVGEPALNFAKSVASYHWQKFNSQVSLRKGNPDRETLIRLLIEDLEKLGGEYASDFKDFIDKGFLTEEDNVNLLVPKWEALTLIPRSHPS